jgi:phosphohistidine phosphatase
MDALCRHEMPALVKDPNALPRSLIMHCYLVRHGEAVSANINPERPLSVRGRAQVAQLGQLALKRNVSIPRIYHSGIVRARQTAEILAGYLNPASGISPANGLLPEDDPEFVKAEIAAVAEPTLWVGHLPFMERLTALLVTGDATRKIVDFSPATMLCCTHHGAGWAVDWQIGPTEID